MNPSLQGGIFGLVLGLAGWAICQFVASRIENGPMGPKRMPVAKALRAVGVLVLVVDIVVGYLFMGPAVQGIYG